MTMYLLLASIFGLIAAAAKKTFGNVMAFPFLILTLVCLVASWGAL